MVSKFAEKLQRFYKKSAPAIGFRKAPAEAENPPLLIMAGLALADSEEAAASSDRIDAGLVGGPGLDAKKFRRLVKAMGDVPVGLAIGTAGQGQLDELIDAGCDFVVFDLKTPLSLVSQANLGNILRIPPSLDSGLVRAICDTEFSVDGVLIDGEYAGVTMERLLVCQRFASLLDKPLLVAVGPSPTFSELSVLCHSGAKGIALPEGASAKALAELKKTISSLPKPSKRAAKSISPLLPRLEAEPMVRLGEEED